MLSSFLRYRISVVWKSQSLQVVFIILFELMAGVARYWQAAHKRTYNDVRTQNGVRGDLWHKDQLCRTTFWPLTWGQALARYKFPPDQHSTLKFSENRRWSLKACNRELTAVVLRVILLKLTTTIVEHSDTNLSRQDASKPNWTPYKIGVSSAKLGEMTS